MKKVSYERRRIHSDINGYIQAVGEFDIALRRIPGINVELVAEEESEDGGIFYRFYHVEPQNASLYVKDDVVDEHSLVKHETILILVGPDQYPGEVKDLGGKILQFTIDKNKQSDQLARQTRPMSGGGEFL